MKVKGIADTGKEIPHTYSPHQPMTNIIPSERGIEKLLKNLNPHKAAGPDQIRPIILKNISKEISPILAKLFQKSLHDCNMPDIWKLANIANHYHIFHMK